MTLAFPSGPPRRRRGARLALLALLWTQGCLPVLDANDPGAFPCREAADCLAGYACLLGRCAPPGTVVEGPRLAAGLAFGCALRPDQTARCWGQPPGGGGPRANVLCAAGAPPSCEPLGDLVELAAAWDFVCVRRAGGDVRCQGGDTTGQLGDGGGSAQTTPIEVGPARGAQALAAGVGHVCAIVDGGEVLCWGNDTQGQVGDGNAATAGVLPTRVLGLSRAVAIAAGGRHSCAVTAGGAVWCWGANDRSQLGVEDLLRSVEPVEVTALDAPAVAVAAGEDHTCALLDDGTARCWGAGADGQLGNGGDTDSAIPSPVCATGSGPGCTPASELTALAAGSAHTCALTSGGGVECWGANSTWQCGLDPTVAAQVPTPRPVDGIAGATELAMGREHGCARVGSGVLCWGQNANSQLGDADPTVAGRGAVAVEDFP